MTPSIGNHEGVAAELAGRWTVQPRAGKKSSTLVVATGPIQVVGFLRAPASAAERCRGQIQRLVEAALREPAGRPAHRLLPIALQQTIRALLDWSTDEGLGHPPLWALVFLNSPTAPALAHIRGNEPKLTSEGHEISPFTLTLKGSDGTPARALCLQPGRIERISFEWKVAEKNPAAPNAGVKATWIGTVPEVDKAAESPSPASRNVAERDRNRAGSPAKTGASPGEPRSGWLSLGGRPLPGLSSDVESTSKRGPGPKGVSPKAPIEAEVTPPAAASEAAAAAPTSPHAPAPSAPGPAPSVAAREYGAGAALDRTDVLESPDARRKPEIFADPAPAGRPLVADSPWAAFRLDAPVPTADVAKAPPAGLQANAPPAPQVAASPAEPTRPVAATPAAPAAPAATGSVYDQGGAGTYFDHWTRRRAPDAREQTPGSDDDDATVAPRVESPPAPAPQAPPISRSATAKASTSSARTLTLPKLPTLRLPLAAWAEGIQSLIGSMARRGGQRVFSAPSRRPRRAAPIRRHLRTAMDLVQFWPWALVAFVLFLFGLLVGGVGGVRTQSTSTHRTSDWLRAIGLGGPAFQCTVNSTPEGASILVDGIPLDRRTPATIWLSPGEHQVKFQMGEWGSETRKVSGRANEEVALEATLWGSIEVQAPDHDVPYEVSIEGRAVGFAPTIVDRLSPGLHEVHFTAAGNQHWSKLIQVRVDEVTKIAPRSPSVPALGKVTLRAVIVDESGTQDLEGARIWVDGDAKGTTPLTLQLPHGPHSFRARYLDEELPIQVVSLPGGNQRYVQFEFGSNSDAPRIVLLSPLTKRRADLSLTLTAQLTDVGERELREMWLHLRLEEGFWRRYPMTLLKSPRGMVGMAVLPAKVESGGRYYVSAMTNVGDEYFTEVQTGTTPPAAATASSSR